MAVFRRDELRDTLTDTLKIVALVRPDASFVCSIKTVNDFYSYLQHCERKQSYND